MARYPLGMGQKTSVYLADDVAAAAKASGVPLGELVRRGLEPESLEAILCRVIRQELPLPSDVRELLADLAHGGYKVDADVVTLASRLLEKYRAEGPTEP